MAEPEVVLLCHPFDRRGSPRPSARCFCARRDLLLHRSQPKSRSLAPQNRSKEYEDILAAERGMTIPDCPLRWSGKKTQLECEAIDGQSSEPVPRAQIHRPHRTCGNHLAVIARIQGRSDAGEVRMIEDVIGRNAQFERARVFSQQSLAD